MTYQHFDGSRPDTAAMGATRTTETGYTRTNESALSDLLASMGWMDNYNVTISAGTALVPTEILATNGTQIVKTAITYGAGVTAGLPTVIVLSKSTDSGGSYLPIRTCTIAYDGSGNFLSTTWS